MKEQDIQRIVVEVIARLAPQLGADGRRGDLIAVFTGATVGFNEAIQQVRSLVLDGYRIRLVFSRAAEELYAQLVRDQLAGFPHISSIEPREWLSALKDALAVVVPLLSVNTVAKLSQLIADNLATNLILHALFMGKPVIAAKNGADPAEKGRGDLGFHKGSPALNQALWQRLQTVAQYGCHLIDVNQVREAANSIFIGERGSMPERAIKMPPPHKTLTHPGRMVTAGHVLYAHRIGADLRLSPQSLITPLARELASKHRVALLKTGDR